VSQYHPTLIRFNYLLMSTQLSRKSNLDQTEEILGDEVKKPRPNIDELLKRISTERKQERKSTQVIIIIAIVGIFLVSTLFYQL